MQKTVYFRLLANLPNFAPSLERGHCSPRVLLLPDSARSALEGVPAPSPRDAPLAFRAPIHKALVLFLMPLRSRPPWLELATRPAAQQIFGDCTSAVSIPFKHPLRANLGADRL